jgi:hypothetical protein
MANLFYVSQNKRSVGNARKSFLTGILALGRFPQNVSPLLVRAIVFFGTVGSRHGSVAPFSGGSETWKKCAKTSLLVSISFFLTADIDSPCGGLIRMRPQNYLSFAQSLKAH